MPSSVVIICKIEGKIFYGFTGSRKNNTTHLYTFDNMNILLLSGYLFLNTINIGGPRTVYICNNKDADKYHYSSTCRGLSNCQHKLVKSDEPSARKKGMTLCGWEKGKK